LERQLEQRFGLRQAVVASPARSNPEDVRLAVTTEAAGLVAECLKPGSVLAMASGTTMQAVAESMPAVRLPNLKIVEIQGLIVLTESLHELDTLRIASRMAQRIGAEYYMLPAPREVSSPELAAALLLDKRIKQTLELARRADILLVGIGAIPPLSPSLAHLPADLVRELRRVGAVGEISARFYDRAGQACLSEFDRRLVGLTLADLLRTRTRIGVAFGEPKIPAIAGALAGGYVNVLVTDVATAAALLARVRPGVPQAAGPTPVEHTPVATAPLEVG
jgi:DNA-binding transcriptional regulator LsrR (DeoR family)